MVLVNSQEWLDKEYPKEGRNRIKRLYIVNKNLEGCLDLQDFTELKELNCSGNQLTGLIFGILTKILEINFSENKIVDLELSNFSNLKSLQCYGNKLTSIKFLDDLPNPKKLIHLNISNNNFSAHNLSFLSKFTNLEKLFISNNEFYGSLKPLREMNKLEKLDISDTDISDGLNHLLEKYLKGMEIICETKEKPKSGCQFIEEVLKECYDSNEMTYNRKDLMINELIKTNEKLECLLQEAVSPRNILLVGCTGNGKSTLANVLTDTTNFEEGASSTSVTKNVQVGEFDHENIKYRVIDTPGLGDIQLTERELLNRIAEAVNATQDGLNRILFIFRGRFSETELEAYGKLIREFKLGGNVSSYITIVRTHFPEFDNEGVCKKDSERIRNKILKPKKIFNSAEIIYIDNDPKSSSSRNKSRKKLLNHLEENSKKIYKPSEFGELIDKVNKKEQLENLSQHELKKIGIDVNGILIILNSTIITQQDSIFINDQTNNNVINFSYNDSHLEKKAELERTKTELAIKEQELEKLQKESQKDITPLLTAKEKAWQAKLQVKEKEITELKNKIAQLETELNRQTEEDLLTKAKRQSSISSEIDPVETKLSIIGEDWTNIHSSFSPNLIQSWQNSGFTYPKVQEWINIDFQLQDYALCQWLRDTKQLIPEQVLNSYNLEELKTEYEKTQSYIEIPPKN